VAYLFEKIYKLIGASTNCAAAIRYSDKQVKQQKFQAKLLTWGGLRG